jgi:hypothetical protein
MVRVPAADDGRERRRETIIALDRSDRVFVLGYLASSVPDAFDLAICALAGDYARRALPPDPV